MRQRARFIVRVFERFSLTDRDLVSFSLSLLLADLGDGRIGSQGITAGCGRLEKLVDPWRGRPFEEADEAGRRNSMPPTHNSRESGRPLLMAAAPCQRLPGRRAA